MLPYRNFDCKSIPQNIPDFIPDSGLVELISTLTGSSSHIPAFHSNHGPMHVNEVSCVSLCGRWSSCLGIWRGIWRRVRKQMLESMGIWCRVRLRMLHCIGCCGIESDNDGVYLHFFVRSADPKPPYSSLMGPSAKVVLRKFAEVLWKVRGNLQKYVSLRRERVQLRKVSGNFRRNYQINLCNDPFTNDPTSEWLTLMNQWSSPPRVPRSACAMTGAWSGKLHMELSHNK